jgi:hypothetical protein
MKHMVKLTGSHEDLIPCLVIIQIYVCYSV